MRKLNVSNLPPATETGRCDIVIEIIKKGMTDARHNIKEKVRKHSPYGLGYFIYLFVLDHLVCEGLLSLSGYCSPCSGLYWHLKGKTNSCSVHSHCIPGEYLSVLVAVRCIH